ncbi:uncharacterized protein LOC141847275 [Curcuma longa]|uniref:uncharacterized protein LOC141847275 n=1 Tax=Curcuma longa TaxID=136217 RepID=UPI003D9F96C4
MSEISSGGTAAGASGSRSSEGWKQRIIVPTLLAGVVGGGVGLISKHRKALGVGTTAASFAADFAIVTGCYYSAQELARDARASEPDDLINSMVGGLASGALLGRLQGGQQGAAKYAILFAAVGTAVDFTKIQLRPYFQSFITSLSNIRDGKSNWSLPEWSPIQVLDDEAVAAKRAREEQIFAQRRPGGVRKEES